MNTELVLKKLDTASLNCTIVSRKLGQYLQEGKLSQELVSHLAELLLDISNPIAAVSAHIRKHQPRVVPSLEPVVTPHHPDVPVTPRSEQRWALSELLLPAICDRGKGPIGPNWGGFKFFQSITPFQDINIVVTDWKEGFYSASFMSGKPDLLLLQVKVANSRQSVPVVLNIVPQETGSQEELFVPHVRNTGKVNEHTVWLSSRTMLPSMAAGWHAAALDRLIAICQDVQAGQQVV